MDDTTKKVIDAMIDESHEEMMEVKYAMDRYSYVCGDDRVLLTLGIHLGIRIGKRLAYQSRETVARQGSGK